MDLKPPVTIENLINEWREDSNIDATAMEKEILKISNHHSKYLHIMSWHRHKILKINQELKVMKSLRDDYYGGRLTKEDCDSRGWEYMQELNSNPKISRLLETDPIIADILLKKSVQEEIVFFCESVLKSLSSRTYDLGNFVKYQQLVSGR